MALAAEASVLTAVTANIAVAMAVPVAASGRRVDFGMPDCARSHLGPVKGNRVAYVDAIGRAMKVTHGPGRDPAAGGGRPRADRPGRGCAGAPGPAGSSGA